MFFFLVYILKPCFVNQSLRFSRRARKSQLRNQITMDKIFASPVGTNDMKDKVSGFLQLA